MQARQTTCLGGIRMGKNPGFSLVAGVALALAGALVAFAAWGQVARKARIPGVLMPVQGTVQLSANAAGVLTEQLVQEVEHVTAGQALFVLGTDRPTSEGSAAVLLAAHLAQRRSTLEVERPHALAAFQWNEGPCLVLCDAFATPQGLAQMQADLDKGLFEQEPLQQTKTLFKEERCFNA